jgi:hypothetical protein
MRNGLLSGLVCVFFAATAQAHQFNVGDYVRIVEQPYEGVVGEVLTTGEFSVDGVVDLFYRIQPQGAASHLNASMVEPALAIGAWARARHISAAKTDLFEGRIKSMDADGVILVLKDGTARHFWNRDVLRTTLKPSVTNGWGVTGAPGQALVSIPTATPKAGERANSPAAASFLSPPSASSSFLRQKYDQPARVFETSIDNLFVGLFADGRLALVGSNDQFDLFLPRAELLPAGGPKIEQVKVNGDAIQVRRSDGTSTQMSVNRSLLDSLLRENGVCRSFFTAS